MDWKFKRITTLRLPWTGYIFAFEKITHPNDDYDDKITHAEMNQILRNKQYSQIKSVHNSSDDEP